MCACAIVLVAASLSNKQADMESMFGSNITTIKEPVNSIHVLSPHMCIMRMCICSTQKQSDMDSIFGSDIISPYMCIMRTCIYVYIAYVYNTNALYTYIHINTKAV
jgi:hypothetical protein